MAADDDRRNARLYFSGLAVSLVGNSALSLVAGIWVKSLTGSSARAGLVSVCIYAPSLAGPFAGLLADRLDRRRLLLAINLVMAATVLLLLGVHSASGIWLIYLVMVAYGVQAVMSDPAEAALFAEMLPFDVRQRLNGWRLGIQEAGRVAAPFLGAGLFALVGGGAVAVADAASFLLAALSVALLRFRAPAKTPDSRRLWPELTAGIRHIHANYELRTVLLGTAGAMSLSALAVPAQYSLVTAIGEPPAFLGVLAGTLGVGSVIAALTANRLRAHVGEQTLTVLGLVNYLLGTVLYAIGLQATAMAGSFMLGFALPWAFLAALSAAQRLTPVALQGRVSSAVTLALFGPLAPLEAIGSFAITQVSYRAVYVALAVMVALLAVWLRTRKLTASAAGAGRSDLPR